MKLYTSLLFSLFLTVQLHAQRDYWQQSADYTMFIDLDVNTNQFTGKQLITYTNNSPDELNKLYYHLYYNAFQPGSMMDVRSRTISDPDPRVGDRIFNLKPDEIGFQNIQKLELNGQALKYEVEGTILEVDLKEAIEPGQTVVLYMEFLAQVPLQVRRTGRDSKEGIRYSMTQWYPKLCEYDFEGWHANPYVGREFHGIWGDFNVEITLNHNYIVGAGGILLNENEVNIPTKKRKKRKDKTNTWKFEAKNVIDFAWAADPDYKHVVKKTKAGTKLHYYYQENEKTRENWTKLHQAMDEAEQFMNKNYGEYPYPMYAFIQGGDGGMEYPMATLITGNRSFESLVGVSVHEWMHSWYQMMLGTNEARYSWMDEGFTSFGTAETTNYLRGKGILEGVEQVNPIYNTIRSYTNFAMSGQEEALSTHADHFTTNAAYSVGSYYKGSVFLKQLEYILGNKAFRKGMLNYYDQWKYKHPTDVDFIRTMEKTSTLELDWFREYFVNTTHTIDYSIDTISTFDKGTNIKLSKLGVMPMPLDILVIKTNGDKVLINIPLRMMRGEKPKEKGYDQYMIAQDWPWTHPEYALQVDIPMSEILQIIIDPSERLADVDLSNDVWPRAEEKEE